MGSKGKKKRTNSLNSSDDNLPQRKKNNTINKESTLQISNQFACLENSHPSRMPNLTKEEKKNKEEKKMKKKYKQNPKWKKAQMMTVCYQKVVYEIIPQTSKMEIILLKLNLLKKLPLSLLSHLVKMMLIGFSQTASKLIDYWKRASLERVKYWKAKVTYEGK